MFRIVFTSAVVISATVAADAAPKTIVGYWRYADGVCSPSDGAIHIGPKSIQADDWGCKFSTVSRTGYTVTWKGSCKAANGSLLARTVRATENRGRLTVNLDGGSNGPFVRCN